MEPAIMYTIGTASIIWLMLIACAIIAYWRAIQIGYVSVNGMVAIPVVGLIFFMFWLFL